jgi:hypothetical protein
MSRPRQQKIKTVGGRWNGLKRRGEISLGKGKEIGLRDRIDPKNPPQAGREEKCPILETIKVPILGLSGDLRPIYL